MVWVLRLANVDLNPLPGQDDIPAEVASAWTSIFAMAAVLRMNRARLRGEA